MTGGGCDFSFECVGNTTLMSQALEVVQPGYGIAVVVGVAPVGSDLRLNPEQLLFGRTLKGAILGGAKGRTDIPLYVDYYMEGTINIDDLVTHYFPLEQINDGFELMKAGKSIRSVVVF
jgi:S-(hydroxymethyl)glutathione dehydrogenase/alcohol dehydrogenase